MGRAWVGLHADLVQRFFSLVSHAFDWTFTLTCWSFFFVLVSLRTTVNWLLNF